MNSLFELKSKVILNIDTTILYTSSFNYIEDAIYFINNNCVVITKERSDIPCDIKEEYYSLFNELDLKNKKNLTEFDELKLKILSSLNSKKEVFVFFNVLTYLDNKFKNTLIKYLQAQEKRIINYTTDIEETLLLDYLIILHQNKVIMEGKKELVLQEEKILKKLGYNLPIVVNLSSNLKYYGLVNKTYFNNKELVDELWN